MHRPSRALHHERARRLDGDGRVLSASSYPATLTAQTGSYGTAFDIGETIGECGSYAGTVDLVCETGKSLEFAPVFGCQAEVHAQEGFGSVEFVNSAGSPSDFTINWNVEGFQYTVIKDGFGCPYS